MKPTVIVTILAATLASACDYERRGALGGAPDAADDGDSDPDAAPGAPDARPPDSPQIAELLELVASCDDELGGQYATDVGDDEHIAVCGLPGAVFWKADLDVDCDGAVSDVCNWDTDPSFQNQTSATTSSGDWLDAASLPYVVVPLPSDRWDYGSAGLDLGAVIAVIYDGRLEFGVFGDQGPDSIIGEASYRMAELLGIDPDPATGGADDGAVYIAFSGESAVVEVIEDHDEAVAIGEARVAELLAGE